MKRNPSLKENARSLRKNQTKEEALLWFRFLRRYPLRFRRQYIIGNYIVDFYCHSAKLAVELDGSQHYDPSSAEYDRKRTAALNSEGIHVLRFTNSQVLSEFENVCNFIHHAVLQRTHSFSRGEAVERSETDEECGQ